MNNIKSELMKLIKDRVTTYYPEISSANIVVRDTHPLQKYHTSIIYQFDVLKDNYLYKSIVVKKRIFNPIYDNDIERDTRIEFNNLKLLSEKEIRHTTPLVLDAIPQEGILITERVKGERLAIYLKRFSYLPLSKKRFDFLFDIFIKTGEWLREFHRLTNLNKTEKIDTEQYIAKAKQILNNLYMSGFSQDLGEKIIERMKEFGKEILDLEFPVVFKHGDFQPMNILCQQNKIIVTDIDSRKEDTCIKDVSNFIVGAYISDNRCIYSTLDMNVRLKLVKRFLSVYFGVNAIPYAAVNFCVLLGMLEFLESTLKRNQSYLKRAWLMRFYHHKIHQLLENYKNGS